MIPGGIPPPMSGNQPSNLGASPTLLGSPVIPQVGMQIGSGIPQALPIGSPVGAPLGSTPYAGAVPSVLTANMNIPPVGVGSIGPVPIASSQINPIKFPDSG